MCLKPFGDYHLVIIKESAVEFDEILSHSFAPIVGPPPNNPTNTINDLTAPGALNFYGGGGAEIMWPIVHL